MAERELYFDLNEQDWTICHDGAWLGKEIEDIPLVVVMKSEDDYYIWCKEHRRFELVKKNTGIDWETDTCDMRGFAACFRYRSNETSSKVPNLDYHQCYNPYKESLRIPIRWRLRSDEKTTTVYVSVDICDVIIRYNKDQLVDFAPRIRCYRYGVASYALPAEEKNYFQEKLAYPEKVIYHIMDMLADLAKNIYGIKPAIPEEKIKGENTIMAFMFRPFDLNCYELTRYVPVSKCVPKDCKNAYHIFCEQLGIKPPKGMKKIYYHNPLALPMYRVLLELGVRDYNLMRLFLDGVKIGRLDFATLNPYIFPFWDDTDYEAIEEERKRREQERKNRSIGDGISQAEIDDLLDAGEYERVERRKEYREWNQLKFIMDWLLKEKGEMVTVWRLHKYTKNGPKNWQQDISSMIYQYFDNLSDKIKQEFLDKGFTVAVHDNLVYEINHLDYMRREIKYFWDEEALECEINGFRFELPRYTDEYVDIGKEMNNCVAAYIPRDTYYKDSVIVAVRKDGRCEACIEVIMNDCCIRQAFGVSNEYLAGDVLTAVIIWSEKMLLYDRNHCLEKNEPVHIDRTRAVCKDIPGKRTYFIYSLKELLSLPAEERGNGFYMALTTKFVTAEFNQEKIPPNISINEIPGKDEQKYIQTLFPQLDCVIEAAINGVMEAQVAMYKLYSEFLPRNLARKEYWKKKAERRDFPKLLRNVYVAEDFL